MHIINMKSRLLSKYRQYNLHPDSSLTESTSNLISNRNNISLSKTSTMYVYAYMFQHSHEEQKKIHQ